MSPVLQLLLELSILIAAAKLARLLSTKVGQPAVLGGILAGVLLGLSFINLQALPVFTATHLPETITELAEIGVILLMFLAGLEVDLRQMRRSGRVVVLAGLLGVAVPWRMGLGVARPFGYPMVEAFAIGLLLTATSVSISAQTLLELGFLGHQETHNRTLFAVLPDGFAVEKLFDATEAVLGKLEQPGNGIMCALPVLHARGHQRVQ